MANACVGVREFVQIFFPYEVVKHILCFISHGEGSFAPGSDAFNSALQVSKQNTAQFYGVAICLMAMLYSIMGGMHGIVLADVIKYSVMIVCSLFVGVIAMRHLASSGVTLTSKVPTGWDSPFFGKELGLDWSNML